LNYNKKTIILILLASLIRGLLACSVELGNDEVYYRLYASYIQWNYFDHPPMVGWLIRFTTLNLNVDNEFFIRLGAIISAAAATWLIFLCGKKLGNAHTGFMAACMYTVSIYSSVIAGVFILPDSPQLVCWLAALYLLIELTDTKNITSKKNKQLLLFGLIAGLGMLCKIHTAFLWLGLVIYLILYNRKWFLQPSLYVSGALTMLCCYPIIKWNFDNHFVTYLYHSNRVSISSSGFSIMSMLSFIAGQFLYTNPVVFIIIIITLSSALRNNLPIKLSHKRLLLLTGFPLIATALVISFFKPVLPHWTGPAYCSLILLAACYFSKRNKKIYTPNKFIPRPIIIAGVFCITFLIAGVMSIHLFPGTLGSKQIPRLGDGDFTLDLIGWCELENRFKDIRLKDMQTEKMKKDAMLLSNKWFPAAHLDYYVARPLHMDLICLGEINDIHQYAWVNPKRKKLMPGDDAYCIVPSNYYFDVQANFSSHFDITLPLQRIEQKRNGLTCRVFYVWRMKNYKP